MKLRKKSPSRLTSVPFRGKFLILAFLFPFIGMLAVMLFNGCEPFGNNYAFLYSDEYHQYYPFFVAFRKALLSGDSILYTWDVGMGMDHLGLISYYLGSPLNLLSIFVPESLTLEYFALLSPIKLGLAGLFFAIFLKKTFNKNDLSIAVFGSFYALCAWALGYQWNIMWLDTFALLPLVVVGTISLLRDKKFILYTVTLFLSIAINYYIGLFTCIFVLLVFICYEICRFQGFRRFFADLGRIALFSALAIAMTAFIALPTLASLQNTVSSNNTFPTNFGLNVLELSEYTTARDAWKAYEAAVASDAGFLSSAKSLAIAIAYSFPPILKGMRMVAGNMGGGIMHSFMEGLPNLYCGVGTIIMVFLFLTAKGVKIRDKICSISLLIFFMLSFLIRQLDYMWHGFHFTNMIPYRFSFLFSFVMLYMAYRTWLMRDSFKLWQIIVSAILAMGIMMCSDLRTDLTYLAFNLAFWALYVGLFAFNLIQRKSLSDNEEEPNPEALIQRQNRWKNVTTYAFIGIMVFELILNLANFGFRFSRSSVSDYPKNSEDTKSAVGYMKSRERNNLFYRAEVTHSQTLNDSTLNDYDGISTFTSSANVRTTEFMRALGYSAKGTYNRYCFEEGSPVSNLFLNLKYMIERDGDVEENPYFDTIHNFGDVYLLENNAYLPLGFLVESSFIEKHKETATTGFQTQNTLFTNATGIEDAVWIPLTPGILEVTADGVTIGTQTASGYTSYSTTNKGTLLYTYTIDQEGFLCLEMDMSERNKFKVYKNHNELYSESLTLKQMIAVSQVAPGDIIEVEITCKKDEDGTVNIQGGVMDEEVFRRGYDILSASTLELTHFSNTRVEGTIDCNRDGLLYTSIPHDGNWTVEVDGKPAEFVLAGKCMISVELTEGSHTVCFSYSNKAFSTGLIVSISSALVFAGIIVLTQLFPRKKGKYEKVTDK